MISFLILLNLQTLHAAKENNDDRKNGFFVDMSINVTAINHNTINNTGNTTTITTKTSNVSGVESMFFLNLGYIYDDEYKYEFGLGFGATPLNIKGSYPIGIDNALTRDFTFTRALAIRVPSTSKVGINLSMFDKNYVHSRYINLGLDSDMFIHASGIAPFSAAISMLDFYLEYEGSKKMNKNLRFEYSAAVGYTLGTTQFMGLNGSTTPKLKLFDFSNATHGFLLRGSIGARYKLGVRANAFIKGIFTYRYMSSQSKNTPIVNASAIDGDVIIPDARANARYPAFNMVYGGLQFGVGF
ncbi:hypothetical protein DCO60_02715 [Helicobacter saguini]|uniref:Uncharacterized protein n=1 Tax=Helicobacter saguini TaxID=1548018 RepID=A0A4V6I239_9HELI|nr:hypothetical protein [Helicobacter saguini]MWV61386.1 hypothetical protein [Helicobacter saguini]MWV72491.1 hypothetical protein [Helicobacter saguini]TLD94762.1 hypothetical protein LS64_004435 [Helicobacter saguini]